MISLHSYWTSIHPVSQLFTTCSVRALDSTPPVVQFRPWECTGPSHSVLVPLLLRVGTVEFAVGGYYNPFSDKQCWLGVQYSSVSASGSPAGDRINNSGHWKQECNFVRHKLIWNCIYVRIRGPEKENQRTNNRNQSAPEYIHPPPTRAVVVESGGQSVSHSIE